jgi:hypothetical protein
VSPRGAIALLALLVGCTAPDAGGGAAETDAADSGRADTGPDEPVDTGSGRPDDTGDGDPGDDDTGDPDGLRGVAQDPPRALPDAFAAINQHGEARSVDWFTGDPSVIWFFRDTGAS